MEGLGCSKVSDEKPAGWERNGGRAIRARKTEAVVIVVKYDVEETQDMKRNEKLQRQDSKS